MLPILIFLFVFSVYPIISAFFNSFKNIGFTGQISYGIGNYQRLLIQNSFQDALRNSSILFFVSSPLALFIGFILAILLSRLSNKISQKLFISALYSQFFISAFAIGVSFTFLFGDKNVFAKLINANFSFVGGKNKIELIWLYIIYQLWRAIPFNTVLFFFAINSIESRYAKNIKVDNLSIKDRIFYLYFKEIGNNFIVIAYTNFIFATMLYPSIITGKINLDLNRGHTIASYIIDLKDDIGKQNATAFIALLFLFSLFSTFIILNPKIWIKIYQKIITTIRRKNEKIKSE
ncbi:HYPOTHETICAL PROTEIN MCJ_003260 [Mesomycoplasma conjunctivae]|uniref:Uncharacterized protein n=2 Tax=Mesomycoplasma conjunctivae TaxID=45361 RepID=C5J6C5_MESCH|nr:HYPOTHETICAL PROTEIN MCJ_003260 [Mesomycoplasma conjunctivae]